MVFLSNLGSSVSLAWRDGLGQSVHCKACIRTGLVEEGKLKSESTSYSSRSVAEKGRREIG